MTIEKKIREKYGLTQPDFALYLSTSLSLLKLAETGARNLPAAASIKLSAIVIFDAQADATKKETNSPFTESIPAATNKKLTRAVQKYELMLYTTQRQLEKIETRFKQAECLLALCNYFLQQNPADREDVLWLEAQQITARQKLKRYGPAEQECIQWKIACLEFGIKKGKEMPGITLSA